jgi:hypothetical protein
MSELELGLDLIKEVYALPKKWESKPVPVVSEAKGLQMARVLSDAGFSLTAGVLVAEELGFSAAVGLCEHTAPFHAGPFVERERVVGPYLLGDFVVERGVGIWVKTRNNE